MVIGADKVRFASGFAVGGKDIVAAGREGNTVFLDTGDHIVLILAEGRDAERLLALAGVRLRPGQ